MDRRDASTAKASAAATECVAVEGSTPESLANVRIYVGGLGEGVTTADMEKTFSSLGCASRVEFVERSDSRRFAFMDFQPHSEKSLAKLFTTYNGCVWKGGKLKLEKAKEHYMDRLKREWAEDVQIMTGNYSNPGGDESFESSEELKLQPEEKNHLKIFFPKFKKVKTLPFKGTGRHKYSFQRVEVPSLPVNFCDCEEHCRSSDGAPKEQSFSNTGTDIVVGNEELNVMNSVMTKLFSKAIAEDVIDVESSKSADFGKGVLSDAVSEDENINETKTVVVETEESEEENFVMNIGNKNPDSMMDLLRAIPAAQDGQKQSSIQQHQEKHPRKRQHHEDEAVALNSVQDGKNIKSVSDGQRKWFPDIASDIEGNSEAPAEQLGGSFQMQQSVEIESKDNPAANNSGKGSTWVQKSSWKDLVGDTSSSLFSISAILPSDRAAKLKPQKAWEQASKLNNSSDVGFSISAKQQMNFQKKRTESGCQEELGKACSSAAKSGTTNAAKINDSASNNEDTVERAMLSNEKGGEASHTVVPCNQEPKVNTPIRIGEVCTFIRTADSEKQWTKAKTALSSYFKKKSNADSSKKPVRDGSRSRN